MQISPIDFAILAVYLAGITLFGARFRRGQKSMRDYFLGGRTAPWWALACSIVATETSTLTINRYAGHRLWGKSRLLTTRARLPGRQGDSVRGPDPAVFPGRILHGLPASRKAL